MGPEAEFFIFDDVRFDHSQPNEGYYYLDSDEGAGTAAARSSRTSATRRAQGGVLPRPADRHARRPAPGDDDALQESGIEVEVGHHEVASGGQCEIGMKFNRLLPCADQLMWFKYVVKNVARKHGKAATFMPKPLFGDNGSGMHVHQSLWKEGKPLFGGDGYAGLSEMALHYIGGIIKHAKSLAAFTNPTTNSYRRLVPGLRGAGQPRVLEPQPLGLVPHPDHRAEPEDAPRGGPLPRPELQPVPRVQRDADRRPRRHPEPDRPG